MRKLTPKQKAFADYYVETGNATQSAISAGYSKNTARFIGAENLTKPNIKHYIDKRMKALADKRVMDMQEALELLTEIGRGEMVEEVVVSTPMGAEKVTKTPDIRERQRAITELLKRHMAGVSDELKEELLKAQIDKVKAETERINRESDTGDIENIIIIDKWSDNNE